MVKYLVFKWLEFFGPHLVFLCTGSVFKWLVLVQSCSHSPHHSKTEPFQYLSLKSSDFKRVLNSLVTVTGKLFHGRWVKKAKTVIKGCNIKTSLMLKNTWCNTPLFTCLRMSQVYDSFEGNEEHIVGRIDGTSLAKNLK